MKTTVTCILSFKMCIVGGLYKSVAKVLLGIF
jgi:hypothetical protein